MGVDLRSTVKKWLDNGDRGNDTHLICFRLVVRSRTESFLAAHAAIAGRDDLAAHRARVIVVDRDGRLDQAHGAIIILRCPDERKRVLVKQEQRNVFFLKVRVRLLILSLIFRMLCRRRSPFFQSFRRSTASSHQLVVWSL